MFLRIRIINGRQYLYAEERWREDGKVRSRSRCLGPVGGRAANWAAREQYHDVLRQNVYRFGKSRPGERYAIEARARAQYERMISGAPPEPPAKRGEGLTALFDAFKANRDHDCRMQGAAKVARSGKERSERSILSPTQRAKADYDQLRETNQRQVANYWATVERSAAKDRQADQQWAKEQGASCSSEPGQQDAQSPSGAAEKGD